MRRSLGGINDNRDEDVEQDSEHEAANDHIELAIALTHQAGKTGAVLLEDLSLLFDILGLVHEFLDNGGC